MARNIQCSDVRAVVVPPQIRTARQTLNELRRIQVGAWAPDGSVQLIEGRPLTVAEQALQKAANQALIRYLTGEDYCTSVPSEIHQKLLVVTPDQASALMAQAMAEQAGPGYIESPIGEPGPTPLG